MLRTRTFRRRIQLLEQRKGFEDVYLQGVRTREVESQARLQEEPSYRPQGSRMLRVWRKRPSLSGLPPLRLNRKGVQRITGAYEDTSRDDNRSVEMYHRMFKLPPQDTRRDCEHRRFCIQARV